MREVLPVFSLILSEAKDTFDCRFLSFIPSIFFAGNPAMTYRLPFHPIPSLVIAGALCLIVSGMALSQGGKLSSLPVRYEELTAPEFVTAAARSGPTFPQRFRIREFFGF